jgi:hypothetical protein
VRERVCIEHEHERRVGGSDSCIEITGLATAPPVFANEIAAAKLRRERSNFSPIAIIQEPCLMRIAYRKGSPHRAAKKRDLLVQGRNKDIDVDISRRQRGIANLLATLDEGDQKAYEARNTH